jgi:hypothetical protein
MGVSQILAELDREIAQLMKARALLTGDAAPKKSPGRPKKVATAVAPPAKKAAKKKRNLTPEGRKRIADAVKKRWAAQKKAAK